MCARGPGRRDAGVRVESIFFALRSHSLVERRGPAAATKMAPSPVRLYVSGLAPPAANLPTALAERFSSFGTVVGVTVPPPTDAQKGLADGDAAASPPPDPVRGFAYVDLAPKDEGSVRRAVAAVSWWRRGKQRMRGLAAETSSTWTSTSIIFAHSHVLRHSVQRLHLARPHPARRARPPRLPRPPERVAGGNGRGSR